MSGTEVMGPPGNSGRPRKTVPVPTDSFYHENTTKDKNANSDHSVTTADDTQKHPESKSRSSGECLSTSPNALSLVLLR